MSVDVQGLEGEVVDDEDEVKKSTSVDADAFFAKSSFRVVYQTNNFLLPQIRDLINARSVINIRPEYQRRLRWTNPQKSRLVESLLLNIPIPPVFFFEGEAARYEVMDGQQRLNAIKEFLNNEFRLSTLKILHPLNGMHYVDCPPRVRRALDRAAVSAIILLLESVVDNATVKNSGNTDLRHFIFERLNTGGKPLNAQELRNAIYPGSFNDAIIEIARDSIFTRIWGIPPYIEANPNDYYENPKRQANSLYSSMNDCQIILRFFALREDEFIRGSMKSILDRCMERNKDISSSEADDLKQLYLERQGYADRIFAQKPFQLSKSARGGVRLSAALHDAVMIALDGLWDRRDALLARSHDIRKEMNGLLRDPKTTATLTGQGNTAKSIRERIRIVRGVFERML